MNPDFTPAAWRVLAEAARWTSCADDAPLALPESCWACWRKRNAAPPRCWPRAALMRPPSSVAGRNFTPVAVVSPRRSSDFSLALHAALSEAHSRLRELPQPLSVATEHLLLGILAAPGEAATWLLDQGLRAEVVQEQIFRWEGVEPGPLEMAESAECGVRSADSQSAQLAAVHLPRAPYPLAVSQPTRQKSAIRNPQSAIRTPQSFAPSTPPPTGPARACASSKTTSASCSTTRT